MEHVERAIGPAPTIGADPLTNIITGDSDHLFVFNLERCNAPRRLMAALPR
jgi:hypothetical protein